MNSTNSRNSRPSEAILLVAGMGSRLEEITRHRPKCLVEVGGVPLLKRLLTQLANVDIERVVLASGFQHEELLAEVLSWRLPLRIEAAPNDTFASENNAVSLAAAMKKLESRHFILCDGDILVRHEEMLASVLDAPGDNVLAMIRFDELGQEEMKIELDPETTRIRRLGKELEPDGANGESLGIQKIGPSAFPRLQQRLARLNAEERRRLYYEDVFSELIEEGIEFTACELPIGAWTEIDTAADLEVARDMARSWNENV